MKIVVANSVGIDKDGFYIVHSPSRWSLGVKNYTDCVYYPWELAYTSSLLKEKTEHEVKMLDGIMERWDVEEYFKKICEEKPDLLIMESSSRTYETDAELMFRVKQHLGTKLILVGQHATAFAEELSNVVDYVCIGEYEETVLDIVNGKKRENIAGLYPNKRRSFVEVKLLPWPEDKDISRIRYHEPNCEYKEVQFYTSRGCPMKCNFCVAANLYYGKPNWRRREIPDIIEEILYLKNKYSQMEGLFLDEEVHNLKKDFVFELCNALREKGLSDLKIDAMSEYFTLDREMLLRMKEAGYYKLRVGIETASDKVAQSIGLGKKHDLEKLYDVLNLAKEIGIKIYGTFTVGAYGSDGKEDEKTSALIYELVSTGLLNDVQISINTPQPGTPFYKICEENKWLITKDWKLYDGGSCSVVSYPEYSNTEIEAIYRSCLENYDKALCFRAKNLGLVDIIEDKLSKVGENFAKVLMFRSFRMWLIEIIYEVLKRKEIEVDILAQNQVKPLIEKEFSFRKIYTYGDGFFNINSIPKNLFQELSRNSYNLLILPIRNLRTDSYQNILEVAKEVSAKKKVLVDAFGEVREIGK